MSEEMEKADPCPLALREGRYLITGMAAANVEGMVNWLLDEATKHGQGPKFPAHTAERIHEDLRRIREGIEGPNPTPLERLLAERVVVCYAAIAVLECRSDSNTLAANADGWKRTERLHRRLNDSAKALAVVQRMRLPASPVYLGGQHVHVDGG